MTQREIYEQKTEELILPILEELQFELVDVEYVKEGGTWYLRAYIDKEGGITVNDCEDVSRRMNELLDEKDYKTAQKRKRLCEKYGKTTGDPYLPGNRAREGILRGADCV